MGRTISWLGLGLALVLAGAGACTGSDPTAPAASGTAADPSAPPPAPLEPLEDADLREGFAQLEAAQTREERLDALDAIWLAAIDDVVVPHLAPWIRHEDPEVAIRVLEIIEQVSVESTRALPVLREAVRWPLPREVKLQLLVTLYEQRIDAHGLDVAQALMLAFADSDPIIRAEAAEYAGMVGDPEAIGPLRERLAVEPDAQVRAKIEWSIGFLRDELGPSPVVEKILQPTPQPPGDPAPSPETSSAPAAAPSAPAPDA